MWASELQLDDLKPETDYRVEVRAENAQGWGAYSRQLIKYRTPGAQMLSNIINRQVSRQAFLTYAEQERRQWQQFNAAPRIPYRSSLRNSLRAEKIRALSMMSCCNFTS